MGELMTYELVQSKPSVGLGDAISGEHVRQDSDVLKVVETFDATDDVQAKSMAIRIYKRMASVNLTTPYEVREKGSNRLLLWEE